MGKLNRVLMRSAMSLAVSCAADATGAAEVVWIDVRLVSAAGAAGSPQHAYTFSGMLKVYGDKNNRSIMFGGLRTGSPSLADATIRVEGRGKWDAKAGLAEERLAFVGNENGSLLTHLRCGADPWLHATPCTVVGVVYNSKLERSYDWPGLMHARRLPFTQSAITQAKADELSLKWESADPSVSAPAGARQANAEAPRDARPASGD